MKMLGSVYGLHEGDLKIGHRRVYDMDTLAKDFDNAGFKIVKKGGYWLKPISNSQIESSWSEKLINAYMELGEDFPDIACNIYVVAEA